MGGSREVQISGYKLIIHEGDGTVDPSTGRALTGSWLWDSAVYLAEWMAACGGAQLAGATVLEVGAGTGLPGLLAASMGAARVVLTDVGQLLEGLRASVAANGQEARVEVRELRWREAAEAADVVLMSDVFFDAEEMEGLGRTMRTAWGAGTTGWAATEERPGVGECLEALKREGFEATVVEESVRSLMRTAASQTPEEGESSVFALYRISRRLP
ncbi:protein-lysine methyltransferase METTL21D-like [Zingiber officinale]|uniref:Uncharacterized protein n=1 Tax=Zingiber officinale TaxID=94328 RepID=A0A8J5LSS3_ZINOF|nr:protein-lysine methyltransferase METTL21D-like [Zingiber officinale]KAG6537194.1 hypothetical protein ZIOFF_002280 [Zingiber officinale]